MFLLIVLFALLWTVFIYMVLKGKRLIGFYFKGLTSFAFILVFGYGFYNHFLIDNSELTFDFSEMTFAFLVFIGLVAGLIGDLFLELMHVDKTKSKTTIIAFGTIIFLIGHLFYIAGLTILVGFSFFSLLIGLGMTFVVFLGSKMMKLEMGKLTVLSYVYSFVIFSMIGQAILSAFASDFSQSMTVFMIGALFFGISDLFLAPLYFGKKEDNTMVVLNLSTYYLGQLLIALSVFFL